MLILAKMWHVSPNSENDTVVVALDVAGAFDKVWHSG